MVAAKLKHSNLFPDVKFVVHRLFPLLFHLGDGGSDRELVGEQPEVNVVAFVA